MRSLNREAFEEKIWNDIIRNNRKRKDNLPTRRETALISLTTKMLQNEIYYYEILAEDDSEALSELEKVVCCSRTTMPEDICTAMMYLKSWLSVIFLLNATGMIP